jgi:hypothetical protein
MAIKNIIKGTFATPLIIIVALLAIHFFFLPPILKYLIEDQGEKRLGRKVEVGYTTFNVFRGSFDMNKFRIYEPNRKDLFVSFRKFYINLNIFDLFKKVYHIESIGLEEPAIHISQVDSTFNFSDILQRFSSDSTEQEEKTEDTAKSSGPVKYIVENLTISSGLVSYVNPDFYLKDTIKNLEFSVPRFSWDNPEAGVAFFFDLASGGNFKGSIRFNTLDQSMKMADTISGFNLANYKHYLEPYLKVGSMEGFLSTRNYLEGNTSTFDLNMTGNLSLDNFAIKDTAGNLVAGFKKFSVTFDSINFSEDILRFDTISLIAPVINYVMMKDGDNFTAMLPDYYSSEDTASAEQASDDAYSGENPLEMMVEYVQESMNNYLFSSYGINCIEIRDGKIVYDDQTLDELFEAVIDSMYLSLSDLTTGVAQSHGSLAMRLNQDGHFVADITVNPRNLLDMNVEYEISSLMVPDFNPFSVYYIAYPFPRGAFNYKGSLIIRDKKLTSENKILIEKINVGDKVKNKTAVSLPIKLALAVLRDRNGDIRLDVPVTGDLNDPKVKIWRIVLNILKNLVVKAATAPFDMLASSFGGKAEEYKEIPYGYLQAAPGSDQEKQLEKIAGVLIDKPELHISFAQIIDPDKEKIAIARFETSKLFVFEYRKNSRVPAVLTEADSLEVAAVNVETDLYDFFASRLDETMMALSPDEKCFYIAGMEKVDQRRQAIDAERIRLLAAYMKDRLVIPEERFSVTTSTDPALINPAYPYFSIKFDVKE